MKIEIGPDIEARIYSVFAGVEEKYKQSINTYKNFKKAGIYSDDYLKEKRAELKTAVINDYKSFIDQAKEVMETIKTEYREKLKPAKQPEPKTQEEKLFNEIQRMNQLTLLKAQVQSSSMTELKDLYDQYKFNDDFQVLFNSEVKKREKADNVNLSEVQMLKSHVAYDPVQEAFQPLEKQLNSVASVVSGGYIPKDITNKGIHHFEMQPIDKDLD
jgi:hypothetical protein